MRSDARATMFMLCNEDKYQPKAGQVHRSSILSLVYVLEMLSTDEASSIGSQASVRCRSELRVIYGTARRQA